MQVTDVEMSTQLQWLPRLRRRLLPPWPAPRALLLSTFTSNSPAVWSFLRPQPSAPWRPSPATTTTRTTSPARFPCRRPPSRRCPAPSSPARPFPSPTRARRSWCSDEPEESSTIPSSVAPSATPSSEPRSTESERCSDDSETSRAPVYEPASSTESEWCTGPGSCRPCT
jgi:hypothetical protein